MIAQPCSSDIGAENECRIRDRGIGGGEGGGRVKDPLSVIVRKVFSQLIVIESCLV